MCRYNGFSCVCKHRVPVCDFLHGTAGHESTGFCLCGSAVCSSKTGMTCIAANSTCRTSSSCEFAEGLRENSDVCGCGSVDCTESTGLFCNAESNMCRTYTIPTCNDTAAQVANVFEVAGSKCACGLDTLCSLSTGSFCYAPRSECSSDGNFDIFSEQTSASCGSNGLITDHDTCDRARTALGLAAKSVSSQSTSSSPYGCVFGNYGSYVHLNTYNSGRACGYNGMTCLCKIQMHLYVHGNMVQHLTIHQKMCICGTTMCSAKTGMTCIAANSTCRTSSSCEFAEGLRENPDVCGCGTVDCTESTGLFCIAARNRCSSDGNFDFFIEQTSGSCVSNSQITDHDTCDRARTALGLAATSVTSMHYLYYPYGCIFGNHGSHVYLNTYNYYRITARADTMV